MADNRKYNEQGDVVEGYLTPDEARAEGVEWHGRPDEPVPYSTPDEARGLNIPWRPQSEFPQYNYNNTRDAAATRAPRTRGSSGAEQLMATIQGMNQAGPQAWQSGNYQLNQEQKRRFFPSLPSYWETPNYSNIPMTTPDELGMAAQGMAYQWDPITGRWVWGLPTSRAY